MQQSRIEFVAQTFAGLELRLFRCSDLYLLPRTRIAPFRGGALCDCEGAKADETDLATGPERVGYRLEHRIDSLVRGRFRQVRFPGDGIDEFVSVHVLPP